MNIGSETKCERSPQRALAIALLPKTLMTGKPFNIAFYALLQVILARVPGYQPGDFVHSIGYAHIYVNHLDQVRTQLGRTPRPLPRIRLRRDVGSIFDFRYEDFEILNYDPDPGIKAPVAV